VVGDGNMQVFKYLTVMPGQEDYLSPAVILFRFDDISVKFNRHATNPADQEIAYQG
jgi:hypothetical protein